MVVLSGKPQNDGSKYFETVCCSVCTIVLSPSWLINFSSHTVDIHHDNLPLETYIISSIATLSAIKTIKTYSRQKRIQIVTVSHHIPSSQKASDDTPFLFTRLKSPSATSSMLSSSTQRQTIFVSSVEPNLQSRWLSLHTSMQPSHAKCSNSANVTNVETFLFYIWLSRPT